MEEIGGLFEGDRCWEHNYKIRDKETSQHRETGRRHLRWEECVKCKKQNG